HPVDLRSSLQLACEQKDLRLARLYLSLVVDGLADESQRADASAFLPRLDDLERKLAESGLVDEQIEERDRILTKLQEIAEWPLPAAAPVPTEPLLRMKGVHRSFPRSSFGLKDLDLEIRAQELVGVVGLNGSGKSTLLRIAAGRMRPDRGEVS